MAPAEPADPLKPGDAPPFWDGPWHPQGLTDGALIVRPRMAGSATVFTAPLSAAVPIEAVRAVPSIEAVRAVPSVEAVRAVPSIEAAAPMAEKQPSPVEAAAPLEQAPPHPAAPKPPGPQTRSLVLTLLAQGPAQTAPTLPVAVDVMRADALRVKARELQGQGHYGHALAALAEALKSNAADAATYAQIGHVLMAAKAPEDAAHHFLLAYMLAPKEPQIGRLTIHAAWALGYVGWAFQIAQTVYKLQPSQEWVEMGRAAMAWLKSSRPPGYTLLCPACRTMAIRAEHGPCPRCAEAAMGAPATDVGFIGLRLLQQSAPTGRLFVGAACAGCFAETVVLVKPGGTRCPYCQECLLAPVVV